MTNFDWTPYQRYQRPEYPWDHDSPHTYGNWSEKEACKALDSILTTIGLWDVYEEVVGHMLQPRPAQHKRTPLLRIDRVLTPTSELIAAGWTHGHIGIEVKASGKNIGPALAQAQDYSRSVWTLEGGQRVWLDYVFVWPMGPQSSTVASILTQNRIGNAYADDWKFSLRVGEQHLFRYQLKEHTFTIGHGRSGAKVGSR